MESPAERLDCVIVGAGIVGCAAALFIAKRGHRVDVFERRADSRRGNTYQAPSNACCVSSRGIRALREVGVTDDELRAIGVPVRGCCVHTMAGKLAHHRDADASPNMGIERRGLNELLLNKCESQGNITLHFGQRCDSINLKRDLIRFIDEDADRCVEHHYRVLVGADGAFSQVRSAMIKTGKIGYSHTYLEHVYKELTLPPTADGNYALNQSFFHLWPRGNFMMVALPNPDKSFTLTLYMSQHAKWPCFEALCDRRGLQSFFRRYFPDVYGLCPTLLNQFDARPLASLMSVKCNQFHYQDKAMVLGDAAHAVDPFLGQGANCALEDCLELDRLLQEKRDRWDEIMPEFTRCRKANCDALQAMSGHRYEVMCRDFMFFSFRMSQRLQGLLHVICGSHFIPILEMVNSHPEIPYAEVFKRAERQDKILNQVLTVVGVFLSAAVASTTWSLWHLCAKSPALHHLLRASGRLLSSRVTGLLAPRRGP